MYVIMGTMAKKVIAFDLDDTLSITKSPISDRMSQLLGKLLEKFDVCVISGGRLEQFEIQVTDRLNVSAHQLCRLHLMPTCGTRYYRYDELKKKWIMQYSDSLSDDQKKRTRAALESVAKDMGLWCDNPKGEIIEDRFSQMTLSALGQKALPDDKYAWAEKYKDVRPIYRDKVAALLPDLEVRIGGTTSTDVTLPGIDKAYGMTKLIDALDINKDDILFIGDKLQEGGNDYPVKAFGIDTIEVSKWQDTAFVLEGILAVS